MIYLNKISVQKKVCKMVKINCICINIFVDLVCTCIL